MVGVCKLCHWYDSCKKWSKENGDLAEIFYLGRSKRDRINMDTGIEKVADFAEVDPAVLLEKKKKDRKFLRGVGKNTLEKLVTRAKVLAVTKKPVLYGPIEFPKTDYELFFDIEDDPIRDFVYMHGVYERRGSAGRFVDFTAREDTATAEREAFKNFWDYVGGLPEGGFSAYYYSHHEKSVYRKMQKTYPDAVSAEQVENFFRNPNVIDLYKVILKRTDWPLGSYSLKEIAQYLGFEWRDKTPSGALSIEWFNKYLESGKPEDLKRILEYNEDDCKATMAVKDALERLSAGS